MLRPMSRMRRTKTLDWVFAILLWLALAFSLGWYYTITYYGRAGWPMPTPESCGALILYYFSVLNVRTEWQAVHWMLVFPAAGWLWVVIATVLAPYYNRRNEELSWSLLRFSLASLPLSLPAPYLAYVAGGAAGPWNVHTMLQVALRQGHGVRPWWWLSPLYLALAVTALVWHVVVFRRVFEVKGAEFWKLFLLSGILYVLVIAGLGAVVSVPLRYWIEGVSPVVMP